MKAYGWFLFSLFIFPALPCFADPTDVASLQAGVAQGDAEAELDLGRDYHLGTGVKQDFTKAAELYRKAAAQGSAKAMFNLGFLYAHAQGVAKNIPTAAQWYQKAAEKGLPAGQLALGMLYYFGDDGFAQDYSAAVKWLTLASQHDDAPAQVGPAANALGSIYETGMKGVPMDRNKSVSWYTKGAELGYALAQANLGRVYLDGAIIKQDRLRGYIWLRLAADRADISAQHSLKEYNDGKVFSDQEKAEGDHEVKTYELKRLKNPNGLIGLDSTMRSSPEAGSPSGPHAAPAAAPPPVTATSSATTASPTTGAAHTN